MALAHHAHAFISGGVVDDDARSCIGQRLEASGKVLTRIVTDDDDVHASYVTLLSNSWAITIAQVRDEVSPKRNTNPGNAARLLRSGGSQRRQPRIRVPQRPASQTSAVRLGVEPRRNWP